MFKLVIFSFLFISSTASALKDEIQILANNLEIEDGVFSTDQGAVIIGQDIRIQAKKISYTRKLKDKTPLHNIIAEGDLMIVYDKRIFIADRIEFDFVKNEGLVKNGLTYDNLWFISGSEIEMQNDRTIKVHEAILTASEQERPEYALKAKSLKLKRKNFLSAKHLQITYLNIPIFYFPYYYTSLSKDDDSKIKYKLTWDSGQGPKFSMRYEIFTSEEFDSFLRFDFRTSRGFAGALETDYHSKNHLIDFKTKNYLAHDTFFNDNNPNQKRTRYRLQGILYAENEDESFKSFVRYDKYSDPNMPLDFDGDDFELNTGQKTEAIVHYIKPTVTTNFYLRPKINSFQSFKQEIPTLKLGFKPILLGDSGILIENNMNFSYLNYQYNRNLDPHIPSFHSGRVEVHENLSRPMDLYFCKLTPEVGYNGIFYTNNPENQSVMENLLSYGLEAQTTLRKSYDKFNHFLSPYAKFYRLQPINLKDHYVFSYDDGFDPYEVLKVGFKNNFLFLNSKYNLDIFGYNFFNQNQLRTYFPKIGMSFDMDEESVYFQTLCLYNLQEQSFDIANFLLKWTINQYVALKAELRHRGKYGFRKVNFEDFTLEVNQDIEQLIDSPISSPRNAANCAIQINVTRSTQLRYESNIGWGRPNQPSYHEFRFDLLKMIASNWRLKVSYMHLVNDDQVAFGLTLVPNP